MTEHRNALLHQQAQFAALSATNGDVLGDGASYTNNKHSVHNMISHNSRSFHHLHIHNKATNSQSLVNGSTSDIKHSSNSRPSVIQHTHPVSHSIPPYAEGLSAKDYEASSLNKRPYPFSSSLFVRPPYVPLPTPPPAHAHKSSYGPSKSNKQARLTPAHQAPKKFQLPPYLVNTEQAAADLSQSSPSRHSRSEAPLNLSTKKHSGARPMHHTDRPKHHSDRSMHHTDLRSTNSNARSTHHSDRSSHGLPSASTSRLPNRVSLVIYILLYWKLFYYSSIIYYFIYYVFFNFSILL